MQSLNKSIHVYEVMQAFHELSLFKMVSYNTKCQLKTTLITIMSNFIRMNTEKSTKFAQILRNLQLVPVYIKYAICTSCVRRMSSRCSLSLHTFSSICGGILPYRKIGPLTLCTQATNSDKVSTVFYMNPETTRATQHADLSEENDHLIF